VIAGAIAIAATAWVASGVMGPGGVGEKTVFAPIARGMIETAGGTGGDAAVAVRARVVRAQDRISEIDGRIVELPKEKGAKVATGDLVCRLALDDLPARRNEARALVRQHRLEHKAATALSSKGYRAETQLAAAAARLEGSKAALARIGLQIKHTEIRAPFDGVLDTRPTEIGDYLQKADVCGTVVDQDPFLVVGHVSEQDVGLIALDALGTAKLITGRTVFGKVRYISGTADPRTRTFRLELEVANPGHQLRDGVTAEIRLPVKRIIAHHLSPALLTLDDAGRIGVRIVSPAGTAEFRPVTVETDDGDGVWVTGLPPTVTVITVGQDFVTDGRTVTVTLEDGESTLLGGDPRPGETTVGARRAPVKDPS
jgi:multidrug efflux system membrane fusion protein